MMRKSFTLIETVTVIIIILIFATFSMIGYRQVLDNSRQKVCSTNLMALSVAVEIYALENDVLPASLGNLKPEHLKKGYAKAISQRDWLTKFSYFFLKLNSSPKAYAAFLTPENLEKYGVDSKIFHCPADTDGLPSYGINKRLRGKKWEEISADTIIIAECDRNTFNPNNPHALAHRHIKNFGYGKFAQAIKKNKKIKKFE